jgi:ATP-dependent helicase/nuclease subunit A
VPDFTRQQLDAIDARSSSVVLSSGAGCGKTTVLTQRYLSHLQRDGVSVGQIVAITFTDRAARQMRGKIRDAVSRELAKNPTDSAWADHLRDLETAPIQTIHSFCGDLLRQFAVTAGLDPHFEVLEEVLADTLRADALRDTLQNLLTAEVPAGQDLRELIVLYGWHAVVGAVQSLIKERDTTAWTIWLKKSPTAIANEWSGPTRTALLPTWIEYLLAAAPKIVHLINLFETTECVGPVMRQNVRQILDGLPKLAEATDLAAAVDELCETAKVGKEKAEAWPSAEAYETIKGAMSEFRKDLPEKLALWMEEPDGVEEAAIIGQRFTRVALTVVEAYQASKSRAGVVDFQDLLVLARDLLRDHKAVRESLQKRYRFLLLDEMQDTDPVQMELVEMLRGVSIEGNKLFAVGDAKQSIYRFRGAEVALFERLRQSVPVTGQLSLTKNYRSQPGILHFVNALCSRRFPEYEPLDTHVPAVGIEPCVEFLWSVPAAEVDRESAAEIRAREADAIARHIVELIASPTPRIFVDNGPPRKVDLGDVVLLFRSMSNVSLYEAALRHHGLDYYLVGGRAFFAQQEIYDLLNVLRTLENPDDSLALAGTLRSPLGCLADDSLVLLAMQPEGLWAGLFDSERTASLAADQRPRAERIAKLLTKWRTLKDRLPIARLIGVIFADTGYDAAMQFEFLGDRKLANLWKLIDLARTFDSSGRFGLAEFIAQLGNLVTNQPREEQAATQPENADVVKIMSIHQAKGLEFPVVFVPDLAARGLGGRAATARWSRELGGCIARPPNEDPPLFTDFAHELGQKAEAVADWHEDLRVLYVACTRARDLLVLSAGLPEALPTVSQADSPVPTKAPNSWMLALGERYHLATGKCLDQSIAAAERPTVRVRVVEPVAALPSKPTGEDAEPPEFSRWNIAPIRPKRWPAIVPVTALEQLDEQGEFRVALRQWNLTWLPEGSERLSLFAGSPWASRLRGADRLLRNVEYVAPWPVEGTSADRPCLRGTIDFLWKESDGWHLLTLDCGEGRLPAVRVLEAWVVGKQFDEQPISAATYDVRTGRTSALEIDGMDQPTAWAALEERLKQVYPVPD